MRTNVRKYLSILVVRGTYRKWFLSKKRSFEIHFYYTPVKKKIIDYKSEGVTLYILGLGQIIGDDVSSIQVWAEEKGYTTSHILK
jgi:hypothetical protein